MANVKITELTAATALAGTDVLPIVDVGADATKKVSVSDLLRNLPDGTASAPALAFADDQNTGVLSPAANELAFATSGTQRLVIDSSGNVGVGVSSPGASLDVESASDQTVLRLRNNGGNNTRLLFSNKAAGLGEIFYQGDFRFVDDENSDAERLRIDSSGNVGIGLTSPGAPLAVASSGGINAKLVGRDNGTVDEAQLYFMHNDNSTTHGIIEGKSTSLNLYGGTTLAQTIDSSGNVGIGTTSPNSNLHVSSSGGNATARVGGTGSALGLEFNFDQGGATVSKITSNPTYTNTAARLHICVDGDANADQLVLNGAGNVGIGTSSPGRQLTLSHASQAEIGLLSGADTSGGLIYQNASEQKVLLANRESDGHIAFQTGGANERLRIDSSGRLLVGTTSGRNVGGGANALVQVETTSQNAISFVSHRGASTSGSILVLAKSRGTAAGSSTVVASGDELGAIRFAGADGTDVESRAASIAAFVDGTPGANDMPGRLVFTTASDGSNVPTERMRIDSSGRVGIGATSPEHALDVRSGSSGVIVARQTTNNGGFNIYEGDDSSGNTKFYVSHNGRVGASEGVIFGSDTAAANVLDDYETGTWIPQILGGTSNPSLTYSSQSGAYEKIGNLVHASFFMNVSAVNSQGSGQFQLHGLPFNSVSSPLGAAEVSAVCLQTEPFQDGDGDHRHQTFRTSGNNSYLLGTYKDHSTGGAAVPTNAAANIGTGYLIGHITYRTD